jgi:type I restriction enzyme S subunit
MENPKLRFSSNGQLKFADWSETTLGAETLWASGGTPSKQNQAYWNGDIPWVSASSMRGIRFSDSENRITANGLKNGSKLAPPNSLLLLVRGSMLFNKIPVGLTTRELAFNQDVKCIIPKEAVVPEFLLYWFLASENKLLNMVTGTGIGAGKLDTNELQVMRLMLPSLVEQQKISSFLLSVDEKISLLSNEYELLIQYKKGVMQKIFNQEIRFKDRGGENFPEWEYFSGDEIFKSVNNRNHNSELPILSATQDRGMYPRSENGIDIISSEKSVSSYKVINKGDYVISLRSFQGGIEYSEYDGISSPAYTVLKPIKEISDNFFRAYFKKDSFISQLNGTVVGIRDGKQISFSAFSTLELPYPCIEEQELIANFLSLIDKKIALCNAELIATKKYKQGLLQQMFI